MNSKKKNHVQINESTAQERPDEERLEKRITLRRFHRDQHGAMSLVTLFTILMLAFLLGMILNVCSHADGKIRMQYSADAATYSSGIVMARGMNSLAFTNHLLCDILALTAFLREGGRNDAEQIALQILDQWEQSAPGLATMPIENTQGLGSAVSSMVPLQRQMVTQFSAWAKSFSDAVLPTCENILEQELIPNYQRALTSTIGDMVQQASVDISTRHGMQENGQVNKARGQMGAHIWRTDASTFGSTSSGSSSGNQGGQDQPTALPVVDAWEYAPSSMTHWSDFVQGNPAQPLDSFLKETVDNQEDVAGKVAKKIANRIRDEALERFGLNSIINEPLDRQIKFAVDIIAAMRKEEISKVPVENLSVQEQKEWDELQDQDLKIRTAHKGNLRKINQHHNTMHAEFQNSIMREEEHNRAVPYYGIALSQRKYLAETYLGQWNDEKLVGFTRFGPMSQFATLWRGFTRGELRALLRENQGRNLLHVIHTPPELFTQMQDNGNDLRPPLSFYSTWEDRNEFLEKQYMFYGTVYWQPSHVFFQQLFSSPMSGDRVTFAKGMLFLPVLRLKMQHSQCCTMIKGGWYGQAAQKGIVSTEDSDWARYTEDISWNLLNQNWHFKLVPTGSGALKDILTQSPGKWHDEGKDARSYVPPNFGELTNQDLMNINYH